MLRDKYEHLNGGWKRMGKTSVDSQGQGGIERSKKISIPQVVDT